jgi:outer membrane protein TolC
MRRGWLLILVLATIPAPSAAADPPPQQFYPSAGPTTFPIDLPTALRLADANNPTVGVARARVREAVARLDRARVVWVPNLVFGPSVFYHDGIDQNRRGDVFSVSRGFYALGVGPQVRFDLGDALYLPLAGRQAVSAARWRSQATVNAIELDVALAYLDLLEVYGLLAINADVLARAEQVLAAAEAGAKAGLNRSAADVNRAATEVYLRREEAQVLRGRAGVASARLARLLLLDQGVELLPFEVAIVPVVLLPAEFTLQDLIATGLRNRPEVAAAGAEVQIADTLRRQARAAPYLPRVQGEFIGGGFSPGTNDNFQSMRGQFNAGGSLVWQLDAFGAGNVAEVRARQAVLDAATYRLREVQANVSAEIAEAARTAAARFETLQDAQEAVRQGLEMYRKYRETSFAFLDPKVRFDTLEPLTAIQALNQARVQYLQQVVEFNRAQFRLFNALGQPATLGLNHAAPQPLEVPVVPPPPPPPPKPGQLPEPRVLPKP